MIAADQWDVVITAVIASLAVIAAAFGVLVKALLNIRDDVRASKETSAATHQSITTTNGGGSVKDALNRIETQNTEMRRDISGMREEIRSLRDRDAEDREVSRIEHGRIWQAIRHQPPTEFED